MIIRVKAVVLVTLTVFSIFLFVIRVIDILSTQVLSLGEWTAIILIGIGILLLLAYTIHEVALAETLSEL